MIIDNVQLPKSSFLSVEKDMKLIANMLIKNKRLRKLLKNTTRDALDGPNISDKEAIEMFGKEIKNVPQMKIDKNIRNYIFIKFDNFVPNGTNPEFRDNLIYFNIVCHYDQWQLQDFELRPIRIGAEIDTMFNNQRLTGIGLLQFVGASEIIINEEFAGYSFIYLATHGEEDKKGMPNPADNAQYEKDFNELFNK